MKSLCPVLMVTDVQNSLNFYCDILNMDFVVGVVDQSTPPMMERDMETPLIYAMVQKGGVRIMLQQTDSMKEDVPAIPSDKPIATATIYIEVLDVHSMQAELADKVTTIKPLATTWYGMQEWYIADPDDYIICLAKSKTTQ